METRASHVLIGAFALATLLLAFAFVLWIGKLSLDREWDEYDIVFEEAVTGLTVGGAVQYNGIQVGGVRKLSLDPRDPRRVIAHVRVGGDTPIRADTRAKLTFTGLTGVAIIQLSGGTPAVQRLVAKPGQAWPTIVADTSALQNLLTSSEDIVVSVNEMLLRISVLLSKDNLDKVAAIVDHVETVTASVAERSDGLGQAIADASEASRTLKATLIETERLVSRLDAIAANAEQLLDSEGKVLLESTRASLDSVRRLADTAHATLEANRDSIESFSNQGISQIGPAVAELRRALRSLQQVTDRLESDPSAFLLGADRPKEYDPR